MGACETATTWRHEMLAHRRPELRAEKSEGGVPQFVSRAAEPRHACSEIVPSWNIAAPAGSGLEVVLRVRRSGDGSWSAWQSVGWWGEVSPVPPPPAADDLQVCVDTLQSRQPVSAVQYAVKTFGLGGQSQPKVERLALCFSRTVGGADEERPAIEGPIRLDVPFRSQFSEPDHVARRLCSPTCVAMVLEYYGVPAATGDVASACYDERHDLYGNWSRAVQAAFTMGLGGAVVRFDDWREVYATLRSGRPIVASIAFADRRIPNAPLPRTDGHLVVVCGMTAGGDVHVNDPAGAPGTGTVVYPREAFEQAWFGHRGTAYVFDPPHGRGRQAGEPGTGR